MSCGRSGRGRLSLFLCPLLTNHVALALHTGRPRAAELSVTTKYHNRFPLDEIPEIAIEKDENGGYVQISVSDNGSGIPETVRMRDIGA